MDDLRHNPPKVFLDAVGPGQFWYQDRAASGHDTFPELRDYVSDNFRLVGDVDSVRIYARKDLAGQ
jgi:hypothetical protein